MKIIFKYLLAALIIAFILLLIKNQEKPSENIENIIDHEAQFCLCNHNFNSKQDSCDHRFYDYNEQNKGLKKSRFKFKIETNSTKFECSLTEHTCLGYDIETKKKCHLNKSIGFEYCDKHLKQFCHLEIKQSKLSANIGVGVFAAELSSLLSKKKVVFKQGHLIAKYNGEILDTNEYKLRYKGIDPDGPYAIYFNQSHSFDAACMRSIASLINHKYKKNGEANAEFTYFKNGVFVYALKDIYEGDEIYVDYGSTYIFRKNFKTFENNSIIF